MNGKIWEEVALRLGARFRSAPSVLTKGALPSTPLGDPLRGLLGERRHGALLWKGGKIERALFVQGGEIAFAASSAQDEDLGAILLRDGRIHAAQLEEAAKEAREGGESLGRVLIRRRVINPKDLWLGVRRQVEEIVVRVVMAEEGAWAFLEGELSLETTVTLGRKIREEVHVILHGDRPASAGGAEVEPPPPDRAREIAQNLNSVLMDIYAILRAKAPGIDVKGNLNSFFFGLSGDLATVFEGISLDEGGGLDLERLFRNVVPLPEGERQDRVLQALLELLYFELFEMKNHLTEHEAGELLEIIRQMQLTE